jgi:hypothetical protein
VWELHPLSDTQPQAERSTNRIWETRIGGWKSEAQPRWGMTGRKNSPTTMKKMAMEQKMLLLLPIVTKTSQE